jgi:hypothetical protein
MLLHHHVPGWRENRASANGLDRAISNEFPIAAIDGGSKG